ncbi:signal recognition particle receptor subunit alpha-like [Hydractinia symbiolongicarpus]|uniref:signal recognition particle receptor subunit alpha-like n=1 Tax=Hydractinia symbiolongicarpus TaxID=13093 RepID=UPI00254B629D|nr:signal recognition particle receptor subunit alpha-like [Hydractinia symbiolongicarpus]
MLDFFTIFSKGGIVLWCFQGTVGDFAYPVNELIKNVILQERSGSNSFSHGQLAVKYKLDNEFELVFVVGYQNILQLSYIDKFLTDIQLEFRDRYKNKLDANDLFTPFDFDEVFVKILMDNETTSRNSKREMKSFEDSNRAKKIMKQRGTLELNKKDEKKIKKDDAKDAPKSPKAKSPPSSPMAEKSFVRPSSPVQTKITNGVDTIGSVELTEDEKIEQKRQLLMKGMLRGGKKKSVKTEPKSPQATKVKKGKEARHWNNGGTSKDAAVLDYSGSAGPVVNGDSNEVSEQDKAMVGQMRGELKSIEVSDDIIEEIEEADDAPMKKTATGKQNNSTVGGSVFSFFKGLAGQKAITQEAMEPVLDKMREHLCSKNVAVDISEKLCNSVAAKMEGKVLGTFTGVASALRSSMQESLVQILSPKKRVDILRDVMDAKRKGKPYVIVFCGVNGVGKSTNLAKICFWLLENNHRVMIAACDTFRSGAVEQLRTHTCRLKALHPKACDSDPEKVILYDKGYGKDAAAVSMEAINLARDLRCDVVLVDTAGRMQDNEPLMRSLSKLIKINQPDLVLFVGEALVGNDGVDQLRKFNQALADHSDVNNPHLIDGIVLTKFDTIDDKVGASISMTYETGQPIVFVGTGQTYTDLRNLNVNAVVKALLKS